MMSHPAVTPHCGRIAEVRESAPLQRERNSGSDQPCAPSADPDNFKLQTRLFLLLFFLVGIVFYPVLSGELLPWDDDLHIVANPHLNGLGWQQIHWMFTDFSYGGRYDPLCWLTWSAIKQSFGLDPFFFHLIVLLFHAFNAGLVFLLIRKLILSATAAESPRSSRHVSICAALAAAIWAVHPLRVESTAWAVELAYVQPLFFWLLSGLCYLRAAEAGTERSARFYWGSVGLFAVSILSFPVALGGCIALVAMDIFPLRRLSWNPARWSSPQQRRVWIAKIPFFAAALFVGWLNLHARAHATTASSAPPTLEEFGITARAMQSFFIWAYYLWKPWLPFNLTPTPTQLLDFNPFSPPFVLSAACVIGLTVLLFVRRHQWPGIFALWVAYLALLVPMLGLSERRHHPSDRYSLIVGIAWSILLAGAFVRIWPRLRARRLLIATMIILIPTLAVMSHQQTLVWQTSTSFFRHVLAAWKDEPKLAQPQIVIRMRLAQAHIDHREFLQAAELLRDVVRRAPNSAQAHQQLGHALVLADDPDAAQASYTEAVRLDQSLLPALNDLGVAYARQGKLDQAVAQFAEVLRGRPNQESALQNMTTALLAQSKTNEANVYLERLKTLSSQRISTP
jgi:protein O-mannosyl-transferase